MTSKTLDSSTRRRFVRRATAAAGAAFSYIAVGPPKTYASEHCSTQVGTMIYANSTCRVAWGPPSCSRSCATAYSPNYAYYFYFCCVCSNPCACNPYYRQARVGQCNNDICSGHCVIVE